MLSDHPLSGRWEPLQFVSSVLLAQPLLLIFSDAGCSSVRGVAAPGVTGSFQRGLPKVDTETPHGWVWGCSLRSALSVDKDLLFVSFRKIHHEFIDISNPYLIFHLNFDLKSALWGFPDGPLVKFHLSVQGLQV